MVDGSANDLGFSRTIPFFGLILIQLQFPKYLVRALIPGLGLDITQIQKTMTKGPVRLNMRQRYQPISHLLILWR